MPPQRYRRRTHLRALFFMMPVLILAASVKWMLRVRLTHFPQE